MTTAAEGNTVKVHYKGTLADGTEFDSSAGREPIEFTIGAGTVIPGFERAAQGMEVGETKTFTIPSAEAYGPRRPDLVQEVDRDRIPAHIDLKPGVQLQTSGPEPMVLMVTEVHETTVTLDANHPLAGQDLTFEIELVEIA